MRRALAFIRAFLAGSPGALGGYCGCDRCGRSTHWGWRYLGAEYRPSEGWNPVDFITWLGPLTIWTSIAPSLGFEVDFDPTSSGLIVTLTLPYLHVRLTLLPRFLPLHLGWRRGPDDPGAQRELEQ